MRQSLLLAACAVGALTAMPAPVQIATDDTSGVANQMA